MPSIIRFARQLAHSIYLYRAACAARDQGPVRARTGAGARAAAPRTGRRAGPSCRSPCAATRRNQHTTSTEMPHLKMNRENGG